MRFKQHIKDQLKEHGEVGVVPPSIDKLEIGDIDTVLSMVVDNHYFGERGMKAREQFDKLKVALGY